MQNISKMTSANVHVGTVIGSQTTSQTAGIRPILPQRFNSTSQPSPRPIVQPELNSVSEPKAK